MEIQPYLLFNGCCEEAVEFYKAALDAEVLMLMRFKDNPEPEKCGEMPPGLDEKVMHATLKIGDSIVMASDGMCNGEMKFDGFSLSISAKDETEARRFYSALGEGGKPMMPLEKTFWSPLFGMVQDRFGLSWMVSVAVEDGCA